eukprot:4496880-Pyramimonas_sp.AAC.1
MSLRECSLIHPHENYPKPTPQPMRTAQEWKGLWGVEHPCRYWHRRTRIYRKIVSTYDPKRMLTDYPRENYPEPTPEPMHLHLWSCLRRASD